MPSSSPPCVPGAEPCCGHPARPSGGLWGAPAPLLRPTISGEGESQPMAKEGLQTPRPHGLLYPLPPNPSPLGQCELEGQLHSILRGREKEHSGDAPGIGDAAWGGLRPAWDLGAQHPDPGDKVPKLSSPRCHGMPRWPPHPKGLPTPGDGREKMRNGGRGRPQLRGFRWGTGTSP